MTIRDLLENIQKNRINLYSDFDHSQNEFSSSKKGKMLKPVQSFPDVTHYWLQTLLKVRSSQEKKAKSFLQISDFPPSPLEKSKICSLWVNSWQNCRSVWDT